MRVTAGLEVRPQGDVRTYAELTTLLGELQLAVSRSSLTREQIRDRVNQQMPELIRRVHLVAHEAQQTLGERRLLIIIEGLDKVDLESARNIFRDHAPTITAVDAAVIFTFPLCAFALAFQRKDAKTPGRRALLPLRLCAFALAFQRKDAKTQSFPLCAFAPLR